MKYTGTVDSETLFVSITCSLASVRLNFNTACITFSMGAMEEEDTLYTWTVTCRGNFPASESQKDMPAG